MKLLLRLASLTLCLLLAVSPALGEGLRFSLRAEVNPAAFPAEQQQLLSGLAQLLQAASVEGTLVLHDGSFDLDAALLLGSGSHASKTTLRVYGLDSHWGVRSSLLGDTELMVRCASLLPFGQKARSYLGLPLDMAALLLPYTHADALASAMEVMAPLFPREDGRTTLSRAELDAIVTELARLCDEDPALYRYLQATGLYSTALHYCQVYFSIPELLLPSLTITRSGGTLIWRSGFFTFLKAENAQDAFSLRFTLPTLADAAVELSHQGRQLTGSLSIDMDSLQAEAAFTLPVGFTQETAPIRLTLDAASAILPGDGLHLRIEGESCASAVTLRQLDPETSAVLLTLQADVAPFEPTTLPCFTPGDLTGVDVLSVNGDSLQALMRAVKWPLMTGVFDMVVAAPAPAVQALMDYAEDSGLIDMLTDAMSGSSGY